jgi:hypothetical protein
MTYTTDFTKTAAPVENQVTSTPAAPSLDKQLQAALEHARRLTEMYGTNPIEVALAWETVDELQKALAQKKEAKKTPFEQYWEEYPDAPECRIYGD